MSASGNREWFRKKNVGYGFSPQTWQGWLVTLVPVIVIVAIIIAIAK
jgi:hypothetical protein